MIAQILIVEDQAEMRRQLREFVQLAHPAALVIEAADALAALRACAVRRPDVVLMDIELPDLDGISLTGYIRLRDPHTYIIVVSHHAADVYRERSRAAGADGYVTKDTIVTHLPSLLERALSQRKRQAP